MIYFRAELVGNFSGTYIATVTANGNMSKMRLMADSLVQQMTVAQRMSQLFNATDKQWFRRDDQTLNNGNWWLLGLFRWT